MKLSSDSNGLGCGAWVALKALLQVEVFRVPDSKSTFCSNWCCFWFPLGRQLAKESTRASNVYHSTSKTGRSLDPSPRSMRLLAYFLVALAVAELPSFLKIAPCQKSQTWFEIFPLHNCTTQSGYEVVLYLIYTVRRPSNKTLDIVEHYFKYPNCTEPVQPANVVRLTMAHLSGSTVKLTSSARRVRERSQSLQVLPVKIYTIRL